MCRTTYSTGQAVFVNGVSVFIVTAIVVKQDTEHINITLGAIGLM